MDEVEQLQRDVALAMAAIKELDDNLAVTDEEIRVRGLQHNALAAHVLAVESVLTAIARTQEIDWQRVTTELRGNATPVAEDALSIVLQMEMDVAQTVRAFQ